MINSRWKLQLIENDDSVVEYSTDESYKLQHLKNGLEYLFTKDQLLKMIKDDEFFSVMFKNTLSDRDIIVGRDLINKEFR